MDECVKPEIQCEKYKYLGVVIDKNLNWKAQIEHVCKKVSKACGAISKLRHCLDTKLLVEVYHSLIHLYSRYGIMVGGFCSPRLSSPGVILLDFVPLDYLHPGFCSAQDFIPPSGP